MKPEIKQNFLRKWGHRLDSVRHRAFLRAFTILNLVGGGLVLLLFFVQREDPRDKFISDFAGRCLLALTEFEHKPESASLTCQELARATGAEVALVNSEGFVIADSASSPHRRQSLDEATRSALGGSNAIDFGGEHKTQTLRFCLPWNLEGRPLSLEFLTPLPARNHASVLGLLFQIFCASLLLAFLLASSFSRALIPSFLTLQKQIGLIKDFSRLPPAALDISEFIDCSHMIERASREVQRRLSRLEAKKQRWKAAFNTIPRGLIVISAEKTVLSANNMAYRLFQRKVSDQPEPSLISAFRNGELNRLAAAVLKSQSRHDAELRILSPLGMCYLSVTIVPLQYQDDLPPGALITLEDVTQLRRLEDMRRDFVANVSHELKTPITIIKGYMESAESLCDGQPRLQECIDIASRHATRLHTIVDDLLILSRLEQQDSASFLALLTEDDLALTAARALDLVANEACQVDATLREELESIPFKGAHSLIEQALRNLLENALRYGRPGGTVTLSLSADAHQVRLRVHDDGPGIPQQHQRRLFERFYRVDKSRDRKSGGSGLGLAIVKHIAQVHGGEISLESSPSAGTTFTLTLPLRT